MDTMTWMAAMIGLGLLTLLALAGFVWFCDRV